MPRPRTKTERPRSARTNAFEPLETRLLMSTVVVNTTADSTDAKGSSTVSLRDAIAIANTATSATTITFSPTVFATAKTITLGGTELQLTNTKESTTITGPVAALTISGNNKSTVFQIGTNVTAVISGVMVTAGFTTTDGGGIYNLGTLTLSNSTVSDCEVDTTDGGGGGGIASSFGDTITLNNVVVEDNKAPNTYDGGIFIASGTATATNIVVEGNTASGVGGIGFYGTATIKDSTIANNTGGDTGGIQNYGGKLTLVNDTISGNHTTTEGGGISDVTTGATLVVSDCTIANNSDSGPGGGIFTTSNVLPIFANDIVAGNAGLSDPDVDGSVKSSGHNLIGKTDGSTGWISSDYTGTVAKPLNAMLGSLANNGGTTQTLLPLTGSPAIDKGSNSLIPSGTTTDQRGLPRTFNGTVDIGAVEVQPLIQITAPGSQTATINVSKSVTLGTFTQYTNDTPFKDTITWGDGSASTTLSLTAAGTIPATAHAFAKSGTITVTEVITDAKGNKSNTVTFNETVAAALGSISGLVFDDANGNGKQDSGEFGLGLWTVYLDTNDNGKIDSGEKSVTTDVDGKFSFTGLAAGTYYIRVVPVDSATSTTASGNMIKVVLTAGEVVTTAAFGEK